MKWQDMYEAALERVKQLNKEISLLRKDISLLQAILRSYLPIIEERKSNEKRWVVSMYKVDQSSYRAIQFILLCWVWIMGDVMSWSAEHRSVGIYSPELHISSEDKGEIIYFLIYVAVSEFGKKLDSKYVCPVYCGVNHKHSVYFIGESDGMVIDKSQLGKRFKEKKSRKKK